jgi:hypothetical protein
MKAWTILRTQKNGIMVAAALLLLVALLLPQIALAAGPPAAPQFTCTGLGFGGESGTAGQGASCDHYLGLLGLYRTGALEYHAPGR